jgi:hypothetical protein
MARGMRCCQHLSSKLLPLPPPPPPLVQLGNKTARQGRAQLDGRTRAAIDAELAQRTGSLHRRQPGLRDRPPQRAVFSPLRGRGAEDRRRGPGAAVARGLEPVSTVGSCRWKVA